MPFPAELTNAIDDVTEIVAAHLNNLEAKVGVDGSAVATTLDYLLKNPASLNPGHKHSLLDQLGINTGGAASVTKLQVVETVTTSPRGIMSSQYNNGTEGARFHMRKGRGTLANPAAVVSGDMLGRLVASGYDGGNYQEMAAIEMKTTGTIGSGRIPTRMAFLVATDAAPSVLTERMCILPDGNVGINSMNPDAKIDVRQTSAEISGNVNNTKSIVTANPTGATTANYIAGYFSAVFSAAQSGGNLYGLKAITSKFGATTLPGAFGIYIQNQASGAPGTNVTETYGLYVDTPTHGSSAALGTVYGLFLNTLDDGLAVTKGYGIYQAGSSDVNYFAGITSIGTTSPNAAALLHLASTTKGFLPPAMTTAQKNAISSPPAGLVVYDSTLNKLCVYTGAAWETVASS